MSYCVPAIDHLHLLEVHTKPFYAKLAVYLVDLVFGDLDFFFKLQKSLYRNVHIFNNVGIFL